MSINRHKNAFPTSEHRMNEKKIYIQSNFLKNIENALPKKKSFCASYLFVSHITRLCKQIFYHYN